MSVKPGTTGADSAAQGVPADARAVGDRQRGRRGRPAVEALPLLPLRTRVVLPGERANLPVGRTPSLAAVAAARAGDGRLVLCPQLDPACEAPSADGLHAIGTLARVQGAGGAAQGTVVAIEALVRVRWALAPTAKPPRDPGCFLAEVGETVGTVSANAEQVEAARWLWQQLRALPEWRAAAEPEAAGLPALAQAGAFADAVAARLVHRREDRLAILLELDVDRRMQAVHRALLPRLPAPGTGREIAHRTRHRMEQAQREYYLREQLKAIRRELGDEEDAAQEAERLRVALRGAGLSPVALEAGLREAARLERLPPLSAEAAIARTYVEWLTALPWTKLAEERLDLAAAAAVLASAHEGLAPVKERILEHLAVHILRQGAGRGATAVSDPEVAMAPTASRDGGAGAAGGVAGGVAVRGQVPPPTRTAGLVRAPAAVLCLAGPPGTGKTSLARSVAEALGRPFVRVALGGVRDEAEMRGHRRTYVGALPGRIIAGLRRAGARNPVMLLDEIDKLASEGQGDPAAALLEVLDPEQQPFFSDHYLEVPFDLSDVLFVATANDLWRLPEPLRDRLEVLTLPAYTLGEKVAIVQRHLLPRQVRGHALPEGALSLTPGGAAALVHGYTDEAGVRALERQVAALCRKVAVQVISEPATRVRVTAATLERWLGPPPHQPGVDKKSGAAAAGSSRVQA